MKFLISGSTSSAYLFRSIAARVYVLNNDGSPINLTTAGAVVADLYSPTAITSASGAEVTSQPLYSLRVTPDPVLGVYGVGTLELPPGSLASGSTWVARLKLDDGTGTSGKVVGATLVNPGAGFKTKPTITVDGGGVGTGATLTLSMVRTGISAPTITNPGSGYSSTNPPVVTVSGGSPYTPAVLAAVIRGPITTTTITNNGSYAGIPTVTAADGSGAIFTVTMRTPITAVAITNGGSGYQSGTFSITSHGIINGTVTVTGGVVTAVNFPYATASSPSISGVALDWIGKSVSGSGAVFTYTYAPIASLGYLSTPTSVGSATCNDAFGSNVVLSQTINSALSGSTINSILFYKSGGSLAISVDYPAGSYTTVTNQDIVFTGGPFGAGVTVRFNGGGGTTPPTATLHAGASNFSYPVVIASSGIYTLQVRKTGIQFTVDGYSNDTNSTTWTGCGTKNAYNEIIEAGQNLSGVPNPWYWLNTGQIATGVTDGMAIRYAQVDAVGVTSGGSGYTSNSALTFTGGTPITGAAGNVSAINGSVQSLTVVNPGTGYLEAPTLAFSSGSAAATTSLNTFIESVGVATQGSGYTKQALAVITGGEPSTPGSVLLQMGQGNVIYAFNRIDVEIE